MAATTKTVSNLKLTEEVLTGYTIDNGTITTAMLADGAVTTSKIAANAVTEAKLDTAFVSRVTTAESDIDAVEADVDTLQTDVATLQSTITGLSGAMHFIGVATAAPTGTVLPAGVTGAGEAASAGDVVIYSDKEYVFTGSAWAEFGDVSSEGERLTALETKMTAAESDIDTLQTDVADKADTSTVTALQTQVTNLATLVENLAGQTEITQQAKPTDLTTANTLNEIMTQINTICAKLVSAGVFTE